MQTRTRSRSRSRRPVESRSCKNCPGCNNDADARKPASVSSNGTDEKRRKRSLSVANTPRNRTRSRSRGRQTIPPPTTPLAVINQSIITDQVASTSTNALSQTTRASHKTMKISTNNHCLFCFKLCNRGLSGGDGVEEVDAASKKEVCSRYLKLLTRHLDLDIYSHVVTTSDLDGSFFSNTIKKDEGYFDIDACNACYSMCKSFCDAYQKLQQAQLEIGWHVMKMKDVMKSAEKVPSRINDFRRNVLEANGGMKKHEEELMNGFRREFYRKCNRVKGYPKVGLRKHRGKLTSAIQRRGTVGLQRFHQSTPIDMVRNPTASIQVLELGDELILTSRARPSRSKSVPPVPITTPAKPTTTPAKPTTTPAKPTITPAKPTITPAKPTITPAKPTTTPAKPTTTPAKPTTTPAKPTTTPAKPTCTTPASPQGPVQGTSQQAPPKSSQARTHPVISNPSLVKTMSKKSNMREGNTTFPGPSSSRNLPNKKSTKVIHIAKRVPAPSPQKSPIAVVDLCGSDDENDPETSQASPPKKSKTAPAAPVVVEPVARVPVPEAPPQPNSGEGSNDIIEVNLEDDTGKDTGTALAGNQDDNEIVMEISSQSAPQPSEVSTSHTSPSVSRTPEILETHSTYYDVNPPQEPIPSGSSGTSVNENPGMIPRQMDSQPTTDTFTNDFPYYSPHSQAQFEEPQNTQYDYGYADVPSEATGTFSQHQSHPQHMDFEFTPPAPGTGIEFTVIDPVSNGPEMCRVSYTYTRTITSTFSGIPPVSLGMPHSRMYNSHTSSQEDQRQPPFYNSTQDHGYDPQYNYNDDYIPEQFNATSENYFNAPADPQPIVTEVEDENNYANNYNEDQPLDVGFVAIAEVDEDSDDVQVIEEVCSRSQQDFTVTMNLRNESEISMENNDMRNSMETITPPVYICT